MVLYAYVEYGDSFVERLNGHVRIRPMGWYRRRLLMGATAWVSNPFTSPTTVNAWRSPPKLRRLLELPGLDRDLDPAAVASYLQLGYVPAPQSIFQRHPQATAPLLACSRERTREQRRYWRVPNEWTAAFRGRMDRTIARAHRAIGPHANGKRCAAWRLPYRGHRFQRVVAFMARASAIPSRRMPSVSAMFAATQFYNELPYARRVAELYRHPHREIVVNQTW